MDSTLNIKIKFEWFANVINAILWIICQSWCCLFQIEQIRRVNNLWTSDSLFLRSHIHIPLPRFPASENLSNGTDLPCAIVDSQDEIVSIDDLRRTVESDAKSEHPECVSLPQPSSKDFLSKFDVSLAQIKSSVAKLEEKSK